MIDLKDLIKAGVHWGHLRSRWCPRMAPYIWGLKDRVHLIDVSKTAEQLEKAAQFIKQVTADGKIVLWVGTKQSARQAIKEVAERLNMPYVNHRWVGGTLSNYAQVKKSVTRLLHLEDILVRADEFPLYTKKDLSMIQKNINRRNKTVGGIRKMTWPIGAVVLVDVNEEASALREAVLMNIPVVAMVDTNGDPALVDYVIPANDDTPGAVKLLIDYLAQAAATGKEIASTKKTETSVGGKAAATEEIDIKEILPADILALTQQAATDDLTEELIGQADREKSAGRTRSSSDLSGGKLGQQQRPMGRGTGGVKRPR